jgi:hypothetical protein
MSDVEEWNGVLLGEYAEYIDAGTILYLVELIAGKEKKGKREILNELGISIPQLHQNEVKQRVIKEALKRLDTKTVIRVLYGRMKTVYINFIIDVLSTVGEEIKGNKDLAEEIKGMMEENSSLLEWVRDIERRKIIEIIRDRLRNVEGRDSTESTYILP